MTKENLQIIIGGVTGLALLAMVAFSKKLGLDLSPETSMLMIGGVITSAGLVTHGFSTTTAKKLDGAPEDTK